MPIYRYRCPSGHLADMYRSVNRRHDPLRCTECNNSMAIMIMPASVRVFKTYTTPCFDEDGERKVIGSKREHEDFLRRNNLEEVGNDSRFAPRSAEEIAEKRAREEAAGKDAPILTPEQIEEYKRQGVISEDITPDD